MGAVVLGNRGKDSPKFIALSCISIVVAANAGGAFSPFGDITTLMVWQKDKADVLRILRPVRAVTDQLAGACALHAFRHSP